MRPAIVMNNLRLIPIEPGHYPLLFSLWNNPTLIQIEAKLVGINEVFKLVGGRTKLITLDKFNN